MSQGQRISCLVIAIVLFVFAGYQYFELQSWIGMSAFSAAGMVAVLGFFEKLNKLVLLIGIILFIAGATVSFPTKDPNPSPFAIEQPLTFTDVQQSISYMALVVIFGYFWWLSGKIR